MSHDLARFDLAAAEVCGENLAAAMSASASMEEAAKAACSHLYHDLRGGDGNRACVLVRAYKTHAFGLLPPDIQRVARRAYGAIAFSPPDPRMQCLVLLATVGDEEAWNDRRSSQNHQAIPLPSRHIVESAPMIAQLIRELGLDVSQVIQPTGGLVRELAGRSYGVFHVAEARGSPYIPAQDFVERYGVRSVVGFGGTTLATGELFAVIMFSRLPIPTDVADRFRALAFQVNGSITRFPADRTFAPFRG